MSVIPIHKPIGLTPSQALTRLRQARPELSNTKLCFSGRLDPLAEGIMLVLSSDTCHQAKTFHSLDKDYQAKVIFGVATDTFDVMGRITSSNLSHTSQLSKSALSQKLINLIGTQNQPYPPFSAVKVQGKPLWHYAKTNQLNLITIPTKLITVSACTLTSFTTTSSRALLTDITHRINLVQGDFRQSQCLHDWHQLLNPLKNDPIQLATINFTTGPGAYIRSLVHQLGQNLGIGACTLEINRTRVGEYTQGFSL